MRRFTASFVGILIAWLLVSPVAAQGRLNIDDPLSLIRQPELVQQAAAPLIERGAIVVVYIKARGNDADFIQLLKRDGFVRSDGKARVELIAIYVAVANNYSALRYGERWRDHLDGKYQQILREHLERPSRSLDLSENMSAVLSAIDEAVRFSWLRLFKSTWGLSILLLLSPLLVIGFVFRMLGRPALPAQQPVANLRSARTNSIQSFNRAAIEPLAQRFATAVDRLCDQAGLTPSYPAQKLLYQDVRLGLLRLRRGRANVSTSAYTPEEELNRIERQLADFERSSLAPPLALTGQQLLPATAVADTELSTFRQALQAAARQLWQLDWSLADEADGARGFDTSDLFQRLLTLLFETTITDATAPAAIAEAQAIEAEAAAKEVLLQRRSKPDTDDSGSFYSGSVSSSDSSWGDSSGGWGDFGGGDSGGGGDGGGGGE